MVRGEMDEEFQAASVFELNGPSFICGRVTVMDSIASNHALRGR